MPVVDMVKTGANIKALIKNKDLTVRAVKDLMGFGTPQAIYKWFRGEAMPTLDNLVLLGHILEVEITEIVAVKII